MRRRTLDCNNERSVERFNKKLGLLLDASKIEKWITTEEMNLDEIYEKFINMLKKEEIKLK